MTVSALRLFRQLQDRVLRLPTALEVIEVEELPQTLGRGVYALSTSDGPWAAALTCPCRCGEIIHLNLLRELRPAWSLRIHLDGSVTLHPSVRRKRGCRSHFWVRRGRITWA